MTLSKFIVGGAAAIVLAAGIASAEPAAARDRLSPGAAAAIGVLGGLAVGGAIAASQSPAYAAPVYAPPPVYAEPAPVYYEPRPVYRRCWTERYNEWVPGWGWEPNRRTVCR